METPLPERKHPRLKEYDYSQNGCYFVTVCTDKRREILCRIAVGRGDLTPPSTELTPWGEIVEKYIHGMETAYPHITVEHYAIMPNHVHLLLTFSQLPCGGMGSCRPTALPTVIRGWKGLITREIGQPIWQTSFYEHIVRTQRDYEEIWRYIDTNPAKWTEDEYYTPQA